MPRLIIVLNPAGSSVHCINNELFCCGKTGNGNINSTILRLVTNFLLSRFTGEVRALSNNTFTWKATSILALLIQKRILCEKSETLNPGLEAGIFIILPSEFVRGKFPFPLHATKWITNEEWRD